MSRDIQSSTFVIDGRLPNLNDYVKLSHNKYSRSRCKENNDAKVMYAAMDQHVKKFTNPVKIHIDWYEPDRRRDIDNVSFAIKFILDGLVKGGFLVDDSQRYVKGRSDNFYHDKENPRIVVTLTEMDDDD